LRNRFRRHRKSLRRLIEPSSTESIINAALESVSVVDARDVLTFDAEQIRYFFVEDTTILGNGKAVSTKKIYF
jgi:hypothetical protein